MAVPEQYAQHGAEVADLPPIERLVPTLAPPVAQLDPSIDPATAVPTPTDSSQLGVRVHGTRRVVRAQRKKPLKGPVLRVGQSTSVRDFTRWLEHEKEKHRDAHRDWSEEQVCAVAEERIRQAAELPDEVLAAQQELQQISVSPRREHIRDLIEIAAGRQHPAVQQLEQTLLAPPRRTRPKDLRLETALLGQMAWGDQRPEVKATVEAFAGSNAELDYAYFGEEAWTTISGLLRSDRSHCRALQKMLDRHDPQLALGAGLTIMHDLHERNVEEIYVNKRWVATIAVGRYLTLDGVFIQAPTSQTPSVSRHHDDLLGASDQLGARFGTHGPDKAARGWNLLIISDVKTGLVLWAKLVPASDPEPAHVCDMLDGLFAAAPWIAATAEVLIADRGFSHGRQLLFDLETRYGLHFAMPPRGAINARWSESAGVPYCDHCGPMTVFKREGFDHKRAENPLRFDQPYIEDFEERKRLCKARTRWRCACGRSNEVATWFRDEPRLYGYLPAAGHPDAHLRTALLLARNTAEMNNARMQAYGIGGTGANRAFWPSTLRQMQWLVYMALIGPTVRRDAWESGRYAHEAQSAYARQLVKRPMKIPAAAPAPPPGS